MKAFRKIIASLILICLGALTVLGFISLFVLGVLGLLTLWLGGWIE